MWKLCKAIKCSILRASEGGDTSLLENYVWAFHKLRLQWFEMYCMARMCECTDGLCWLTYSIIGGCQMWEPSNGTCRLENLVLGCRMLCGRRSTAATAAATADPLRLGGHSIKKQFKNSSARCQKEPRAEDGNCYQIILISISDTSVSSLCSVHIIGWLAREVSKNYKSINTYVSNALI